MDFQKRSIRGRSGQGGTSRAAVSAEHSAKVSEGIGQVNVCVSLQSRGNHKMQCGSVAVQRVSCSLLLNPFHSWVVLCPSCVPQ